MSRSPRENDSAVLALDRAQLAWVQDASTAPSVASWSYGGGPALQGLQAKPGFIDVIAGNDIALHWVQAPPASIASFAELRLVAHARCAHLYGGAPDDWLIAGDWHAGRPFVCAALPKDVVVNIEQQLGEVKLVPRWHSAWGILTTGMAQVFPSDGWSAVRSPARVVLWHCGGSRVDVVATWPVDASEDSGSAARRAGQQMRLEISRSGHADDGDLHWLDLATDEPIAASEVPGVTPVKPDPRIISPKAVAQTEAAAALALRKLVGARA